MTPSRKELVAHAVVTLLVLVMLFPYVFTQAHVISPAFLLLEKDPWKNYAHADSFPHGEYDATEYLVQWSAWYAIAQRGWADGEWPLWNPYQYAGIPLLANYQSAFLYPPRVLFASLDTHIAETIFFLLKVWMTGLAAYVYARGISLRIAASYFVSLGWMLAPLNTYWFFWCSSDTAVWLPIQLLGVECLIANRARRGTALIALSGTLMLLAGHPESAFTMAAGCGLYFVVRAGFAYRKQPRDLVRLSALALSGWLVANLISMGQLLPFVEYLQNSWTVAARSDESLPRIAIAAVAHADPHVPITPRSALCFLIPKYYGISHSSAGTFWEPALQNSNFTAALYPGIAVLLGMTLLLLPRLWRILYVSRIASLLVVMALFLFIAFDHPVFRWIDSIPVLGTSWRFWFYPFVAFGALVCSASALDAWFSTTRRIRDLLPTVTIVAIVIAGVFGYFLWDKPQIPSHAIAYVKHNVILAGTLCALGIVVLATATIPRWTDVKRFAVVAFLVFDLLLATSGTRPTCPRDKVFMDTKLTRFLASLEATGRVSLDLIAPRSRLFSTGLLSYYGIEESSGYDALLPMRMGRYQAVNATLGEGRRILSMRYWISPVNRSDSSWLSQRTHIGSLDGYHIYDERGIWPRARLVGTIQVEPDPDRIVELVKSGTIDLATTALVETPINLPFDENNPDAGTAEVVRRSLNTVTVDAHASARSVLVLTDQFFPGWNAYVDGAKA